MSNLTSTLTLQLVDDNLAAKAKADAEALKRLGASGADLKKLGAAGQAALGQLDKLAAKGARIDAFKAGTRDLKEQGAAMRQARATVTKEAAALARAQAAGDAKVTAAAEKSHAAALKRQAAAQDRWAATGRALRANRNDLLASGVELGARGGKLGGRGLAISAAEKSLHAETEAANAALREQIGLLAKVRGAGKAGVHGSHGDRDAWIKHHGIVGTVAAGAAGYASAHGVMGGIEHAVREGAAYQHEVVALKNAGRTPEELEHIHAAAKATSAAVPTASMEESLKVINETTGAFGSLEHAIEHLSFMQKAASVVHAAAGDKVQDDAGEMGNKMARFAEERGTAGDGETFERETGKLVRAMVFTRGNFNPTEMLNFAQQAKSSLQGYNERFLTGIMPSIVSTMGGDRAGTAANAFTSVIDGKVNDKKQAEEWLKLGLLDKSQAIMKAGHAMGWRTGAIKDTAGAHADPLQWMEDVVLPALRAKGGKDGKGIDTDDQEQLKQALATMFRNTTANFFANELAQKKMRARLHKDEHLMGQVGTPEEIYKRNLAQDATVSVTALGAAVKDLLTTATAPGMPLAASSITNLARGIHAVANAASDHPALATAAGAGAAAAGLAGAGALSYGLMNGFGLGGSAVALDGSAAALSAAAVELGAAGAAGAAGKVAAGVGAAEAAAGAAGGAAAGGAGKAAKAGRYAKLGRLAKGAASVVGVGALAEAAQEYGVLQAPDTSDGLGRAAVEALDPVLADLIFGEGSAVGRQRRANRAGRQITGIRGSSLPTEVGSGRVGFGLNGPVQAPDAVPLGTGGGGPQTGFGASPVDAAEIDKAKAALSGYRAELAGVKSDMAATSGLDLPGVGEGLEKRKAELEGLIGSMETRLQALGAITITPKLDPGPVDTLGEKLGEAQQKAVALAGTSATPQVGTGGVDALIAKLGQAIAMVGQLEGAVATAGTLRGGGAGWGDGGTPGRGTP